MNNRRKIRMSYDNYELIPDLDSPQSREKRISLAYKKFYKNKEKHGLGYAIDRLPYDLLKRGCFDDFIAEELRKEERKNFEKFQ